MSLLLALHVLDRQLVSADGVLCGKVDDIELAPEDGSLRTAAVLSGSAAWPDRLPAPLRGPAAALFKGDVARAEWDEIAEISAVVRLKLPAAEVGRRRAALAGRARLAHRWVPRWWARTAAGAAACTRWRLGVPRGGLGPRGSPPSWSAAMACFAGWACSPGRRTPHASPGARSPSGPAGPFGFGPDPRLLTSDR